MISVREVVFDYPGVRALDRVGFDVARGTITALVGPNGAGKTTLLRCLAALEAPHAGHIAIEGHDVFDDPRGTHRIVGYLPDFYGLYDTLTVRQCLTYAAGSQGVADQAIGQAVADAAKRFAIADLLDRQAAALSRGQRQRLAIAQASVHAPRLLLLDEPASGLDPEARADLSATLVALAGTGVTILVSSHILTELEDYCSDLLILNQGRLVEQRRLAVDKANALVAIELAEPFAGLRDVLAGIGGIALVAETAGGVLCRMRADPSTMAAVLARLVAAGAPVCRFGPDRENLQDLYRSRVGAAERARP